MCYGIWFERKEDGTAARKGFDVSRLKSFTCGICQRAYKDITGEVHINDLNEYLKIEVCEICRLMADAVSVKECIQQQNPGIPTEVCDREIEIFLTLYREPQNFRV
jgi:hypothetical protein